MPEFDDIMKCEQNTVWHDKNAGLHTIETMKNIENSIVLRWTMLLHDFGKPSTKTTNDKGVDHFFKHAEKSVQISEGILRRFKIPKKQIEQITTLIKYHDMHIESLRKLRLFAAKYGQGVIDDLYKVQMADISGQSPYKRDEKREKALKMKNGLTEVINDGTAITIKELSVNGNDLKNVGLHGKEIGEYLINMYKYAISDPVHNNKKEILLKMLPKQKQLEDR